MSYAERKEFTMTKTYKNLEIQYAKSFRHLKVGSLKQESVTEKHLRDLCIILPMSTISKNYPTLRQSIYFPM